MHRIIIIAEVQDAAKWEENFRTHAELFRKQTSTAMHYSIDDNNCAALYAEVTDLDKFFEVFRSPDTAEAMTVDGVKKETARVFVLDKELPL